MNDLIILVADLDTENVLLGLLPRLEHVIRTRKFSFDIKRHPYRDPGCLTESPGFLRPFCSLYQHVLVVFDKDGCGRERLTREEIESHLESELIKNGWAKECVAVIVIEPEVENWMWINSPRLAEALNWKGNVGLYDWLSDNGWKSGDLTKPDRPKEALEAVLKITRTPRSASIYKNISSRVTFSRCTDQAFFKND